jgi:hypothetical protein
MQKIPAANLASLSSKRKGRFGHLHTTICSALALSLVIAASPDALADTSTLPGDFTPGYNLDTSTPGPGAPDVWLRCRARSTGS